MDVDTIAALSTAPGVGALAVVRVSGPDAATILGTVAPDTRDALPGARTATLLRIVDPGDGTVIDHALVTRFVGPDSYTGEDLVEISCHGGVLVPRLVLEACLEAGARQAEAGEFTRRAYLRGRMDLVQAEAVADLIHARSRALHRASVEQLDRGLSERVGALRDALLRVEALLAHHVDFPEEDDAPVPMDRVRGEAETTLHQLERMLATAPEGELLREGALVVLAGRPNVGKSSLYNALLGRERAIVTKMAGTTRDALEADVEFGGYPFRLVDTAGLHDTAEEVERLGIEVTERYLARADVVLFCVESGEALTEDEASFLGKLSGRAALLVRTKSDRPEAGRSAAVSDRAGVAGCLRVSAHSGEGLAELRAAVRDLVFSGLVHTDPDVPVLTRRRHAEGLSAAKGSVEAFVEAVDGGVPAELAATHLRSAESALEDIVGLISTEDVLDVVFREFCVGK